MSASDVIVSFTFVYLHRSIVYMGLPYKMTIWEMFIAYAILDGVRNMIQTFCWERITQHAMRVSFFNILLKSQTMKTMTTIPFL
jgi:hypothetical protein